MRDGPPNVAARADMVKLGVPYLSYMLMRMVCHYLVAAPLGLVRGVWAAMWVPAVMISVWVLASLEQPIEELGELYGVCRAKGVWVLKHGWRFVKSLLRWCEENIDNYPKYEYKCLDPDSAFEGHEDLAQN
jgi:hypothetical protein